LREEAVNPPDYARLPAKFDKDRTTNNSTTTTDKEAKKREARTRRREARQAYKAAKDQAAPKPCTVAASPTPPKGKDMPPTPVQNPSPSQAPTRLAFTENLLEQMDLIVPALKVVMDSISQEVVPVTGEGKSAENTMAKFIGERGPTAKIARKTELQADIVRFRDVLVIFGESAPDITDSVKVKLKAAEEELEKATKNAPSQVHELKAVQEAKSSFELDAQERSDRRQKGAAKAHERKQDRHLHIQKLMDQLKIADASLSQMEDNNDEKHAAKSKLAMEADKKVLELFDARIAALSTPQRPPQDQAMNPGGQTGAAQGSNQLAIAPPPSGSLPQEPENPAQLREFRAKIEEYTARLRSGALKMQTEFDRDFNISEDQLPDHKTPTNVQMPIYGSLYKSLQQWSFAGASEPFDWETLNQLTGPDVKAWEVATFVLGEPILKNWFPSSTPANDALVPKKIVLMLIHCLSRLMAEFEKADTKLAIEALNTDGYKTIKTGAKRLRGSE